MGNGSPHRRVTLLPILIAMGFLALFFYLPLITLIGRGILGGGRHYLTTLANALVSPYLRRVILFTIEQALLSTLVSVIVGFPLGYLLATYDFPGRRVVRSLTAVPFALPAITVALGFVIVYGNHGIFNRVLGGLFATSRPPLQILYSLQGILLAHAFYNAPIVARFVSSAWEGLPRNYEEGARSLGATRRRGFLDVTLPLLLPAVSSGALLAFIYSFLSFPIVLILGGARFTTLEVEIYRQAIVETNYTAASALATIELLLALAFTFFYLRLEGRFGRQTRPGIGRPRRPLFRGGNAPALIGGGMTLLLMALYLLFYVGPILGVVANSLSRLTSGASTFTLSWYREIFQPHYSSLIAASPLQSIRNSLLFALASMAISVILGTLLAYGLTFRRSHGSRLLETVTMAPLGTSPVALGFAYLWLFVRPPLHLAGTALAIIVVHSVLAVPFVVRSLRPSLNRIEGRFGEAARSLGATSLRAAVDIVLPLARSALVTAAVFAFAVSFAETSATIMLTRPHLLTMPVAIYYLLSGRQFGAASAMGVLLILVISLCFVLIERFGSEGAGRNHGRY